MSKQITLLNGDGAGRPSWLRGTLGTTVTPYISKSTDTAQYRVNYWPDGKIFYYYRGNTVWHAAGEDRQLRPNEI